MLRSRFKSRVGIESFSRCISYSCFALAVVPEFRFHPELCKSCKQLIKLKSLSWLVGHGES
jgi:hypothetical protein